MKKLNFNHDWNFTFEQNIDACSSYGLLKYREASGGAARNYPDHNWDKVTLPHDWAVALPKDLRADTITHGSRPVSHSNRNYTEYRADIEEIYNVGWYRKEFEFDKSWENKRIFIEFEGIFHDAVLWVNGTFMDRHLSGYTGWMVDISDHLCEGVNTVAVRVDCDQPEGWFYEGAGIYRNVFLHVAEPVYIKPHHTIVCAENSGNVCAETVFVNDTDADSVQEITWEIRDKAGTVYAKAKTSCTVPAYGEAKTETRLFVENPKLWDTEHPNLYTLYITAQDEAEETFGFREFRFDAEEGFFLNGKHMKLHGACVHQDFGGVGVALTDNLQYYKIKRLKDMGVNAYRASHNAPSPVLLRACDELGMLVMDETRMFGTAPEAMRQLKDLVRRDRNHACVFIWSIGNEEMSVQNEPLSKHMGEKMMRLVKELDKTRLVTYGGNNGADFNGINSVVDVRGVNYMAIGENGRIDLLLGDDSWIEQYHKNHPNQPIIGSEESSYVLSRGGTVNDFGNGLLDCTGTVAMPWGMTLQRWVKLYETRPYLCGGFMWTGFDYRGEPTPFTWTNMSSSFGTIDLCGIEKPPYYYYQAWWKEEPVLKIAPHWNYKDGEIARITVYTNCESVTLSVNGRKIGTKTVEKFGTAVWDVPFEAGVLSAEGIRNGEVYRDEIRTAGQTANLRTYVELKGTEADDISIIHIDAVDQNGVFCPNASEEVEVSIENGIMVGVGNGDPACMDYEQKPVRKKALFVRSFDCDNQVFFLPEKAPNVVAKRLDWLEEEATSAAPDDVHLIRAYSYEVQPEKTFTYTAQINCTEPYSYVEFERFSGKAEVFLNGEKIGEAKNVYRADQILNRPYRFYCDISKGVHELKVVVTTQNHWTEGFSGYVKLEKEVEEPWRVRLHYGKARVFVKSMTPEDIKVKLV